MQRADVTADPHLYPTPNDTHTLADLVRACRLEHAHIENVVLARDTWRALLEPDALLAYDRLHALLLATLGHPGIDGVPDPNVDTVRASDAAHLREIIHQHRRLMRFTEAHPQGDVLRRAFAAAIARSPQPHA